MKRHLHIIVLTAGCSDKITANRVAQSMPSIDCTKADCQNRLTDTQIFDNAGQWKAHGAGGFRAAFRRL